MTSSMVPAEPDFQEAQQKHCNPVKARLEFLKEGSNLAFNITPALRLLDSGDQQAPDGCRLASMPQKLLCSRIAIASLLDISN